MTLYQAPQKDATFLLEYVVKFDQHCEQLRFIDTNMELANVIYEEASKLGSGVLAELNHKGDKHGATLTKGKVYSCPGFKDAYQQFINNGWTTLAGSEQFGGQGLPTVLNTAVNEIWNSANMAFALCSLLSQGAIEAITTHGSDTLKGQFLEKLISGQWTGTMNLTEPNAGSDLAAVATKALPCGDSYLITGQKIFITWGDHDMSANILHLVLARLPNAPAGVKGISLFVVPKYLPDSNGELSQLNDIKCLSLEEKMGIHASPTCAMSFGDTGGAIGYIVGEPHRGLSYMFTMMNHARQAVGLQGLAISERAYQQALSYSKERLQGVDSSGAKKAIIAYPDVRRMLMAMRSGTEAMRALAYLASADLDRACGDNGAQEAKQRVEFFTPVIKGWMTELAQELTSLNIQVHGGMGFIEESGAAQHYRDARILTIYEGTTGIQAVDLMGRKTCANNAETLRLLQEHVRLTLNEIATLNQSTTQHTSLRVIDRYLTVALNHAVDCRQWILDHALTKPEALANVSYNYLMLMGYLLGGWAMAKSALAATQLAAQGSYKDVLFLQEKCESAHFYAQYYLPRVTQHAEVIFSGLDSTFNIAL